MNPDLDWAKIETVMLDMDGTLLDLNFDNHFWQRHVPLRYAQATTVEIVLGQQENGDLQLTIKDNGIGMNLCKVDQSKHFGLLGMRERAQALHGQFSLESVPGAGTCIRVSLPRGVNK